MQASTVNRNLETISAAAFAAPVMAPVSVSHNNHFNLIRDCLALLVIYSHSYLLLGKFDDELLNKLSGHQVDGGFIAVSFFLAVSGYLVTASLVRSKSTIDYILKRFLRIYPALIVTLLVSLFVAGPLGGMTTADFHDKGAYQFVYRPLMLRDVWLDLPNFCASNPVPHQLNSSLWTIRFEIACYLLLVVLARLGFLRKKILFVGVFLTLIWATKGTAIDFTEQFWGRLGEFTRLIVYFTAGVGFYIFRDRIVFNKRLATIAVAAIGLAIPAHRLTYVLPIAGSYLLFSTAFSPLKLTSKWVAKNDISYGLYLYAWPVQQLLIRDFDWAQNPDVLFVSASAITAGLAFTSWKLVEQPCLKLKNSEIILRVRNSCKGLRCRAMKKS